ncbi:MAG: hypothetical protein K8R68_03395, partial [Bacteroidales bacterium]|nr:hypothetical protein [Bacteroidales bacterium]
MASIIIYLIIMIAIAIFFSRFMKGAKDFFTGGRKIPWWIAGISLYMGSFSAWIFSGGASMVYRTGWYGILYFATWPLGFFIGYKLVGVRFRRSRIISPVEYVETRFNDSTHLVLSIVFAASLLYWPIQHLASLGKMLGPMLFPNSEIAIIATIIVIGTIVLFYTFSGGLWAVVVTDAVQSFLVFGTVVILVGVVFLEIPDLFERLPAFTIKAPESESNYDIWYILSAIINLIFATGLGDRAQRFYSVRDERAVKKMGILITVLFMLGPILFGLVPLIATAVWPDPSMIPGYAGLHNPEEGVFIAMAARYLPPGIMGMFMASMLAASMSAADTCWNTASAIVSVDLYRQKFRPKATDRQVMKVGRIAIVFFFIAGITGAVLITIKGIKLDIIGFTVVILTSAVAIPLSLGIVVRKVSLWSGMGAVIFGTLAAIVASDFSIFGPLEILGFLKYPFGFRSFFIIVITMSVFLLSRPMGRLGRNRSATIALSAVISLGLWFFFIFFNTNPSLSWEHVFSAATISSEADSTTGYFIVMTITALGFGALNYLFCRIYSRDYNKPEPTEVTNFFKLLKTPINLAKEVGDERETNMVYPFVGIIILVLAAMPLL